MASKPIQFIDFEITRILTEFDDNSTFNVTGDSLVIMIDRYFSELSMRGIRFEDHRALPAFIAADSNVYRLVGLVDGGEWGQHMLRIGRNYWFHFFTEARIDWHGNDIMSLPEALIYLDHLKLSQPAVAAFNRQFVLDSLELDF